MKNISEKRYGDSMGMKVLSPVSWVETDCVGEMQWRLHGNEVIKATPSR